MARRERGTGSLLRMNGSPFWYAQFYKNGRVHRVTTKTQSKEVAQGILRNLMNAADQGKPFVGDVKKVHYGDLRAGLMQNYVEKGNKSLLVDSDGEHFVNGIKALDDFFEYKDQYKPGWPLTKITTDAGRQFTTERLAEGVTNSTVNNSLALLRRMLRIAHEDGKLQVLPVVRLLKANPARKGFLKLEDFTKLLGHLPVHLRPLVTFLYFSGCRLGEALSVEWSQVDLTVPIIRLEAEQTKTGEGRIIPLTDALVKMLKASTKPGGLVFDGTNLRKDWAKACVAAGLGVQEPVDKAGNRRYHGLLLHDLRRSAIKNMMKLGIQQKVARTISGHKTDAVFERYNIIDETDVLAAMKHVGNAAHIAQKNLMSSSVKLLGENATSKSSRKRIPA